MTRDQIAARYTELDDGWVSRLEIVETLIREAEATARAEALAAQPAKVPEGFVMVHEREVERVNSTMKWVAHSLFSVGNNLRVPHEIDELNRNISKLHESACRFVTICDTSKSEQREAPELTDDELIEIWCTKHETALSMFRAVIAADRAKRGAT